MPTWTSSFLASKFEEGEKVASIELKTLLQRTSLSVRSGVGIYNLPLETIGISRVTYRGTKLEAITFEEIRKRYGPVLYGTGGSDGAFNGNAFSSAFYIGIQGSGITPTGRPTHFIYDTLGYKHITLFPFPSETLASTTDNLYKGTVIRDRCIVEYIRMSDETVTLPDYIRTPLCRYYTLHKAFASEGKGQDLNASAIYKELFDIFLAKAKRLLQNQFKAHEHELDPMEQVESLFAKPRLPWNYGIVIR